MKKSVKTLTVFLAICLFACSFVGCTSSSGDNNSDSYDQMGYGIQFTQLYKGKTVKTLSNRITNYVKSANKVNTLAKYIHDRNEEFEKGVFEDFDSQKVDIQWEKLDTDTTYTIHVADNKEFNNEFTYTTENAYIDKEIGFFIPGETYYYKVESASGEKSCVDNFVVSDVNAVRYISADKVRNVRDIGGWKTASGKKINYGKIYRGAALNEGPNHSYLSDNAKNMFDYLGIKGEIDLRGNDPGDSDSEKDETQWMLNKIDSSYPILRNGLVYFDSQCLPNVSNKAQHNLPMIFEFLANEDNYPVYFHCSVGADRTGVMGFIFEGLLGVDFEHCAVDYELTSFSNMWLTDGVRQRAIVEEVETDTVTNYNFAVQDFSNGRHSLLWGYNKLMKEYSDYSTDFQEVMEKYLLDMGVEQENINKFKQIMLG